MKLKRGILIVFEGIDGAGKSTQAEILFQKLRAKGFDVVFYREPTDSKWGRIIKKKALESDSLTPGQELELFLKDRKENVEKNIVPSLEGKKIVILDRYYYSTIAYQGAKGIEKKMIRELNEEFATEPDLVFILDIEPRKGLERIRNRKKKDLLFEREEYLCRVRRIFKSLRGERLIHIKGQGKREEIAKRIERIVYNLMNTISISLEKY